MPTILDENRRLDVLRRYAILDTPPEPVFDRIAWLAARHFGTPIGTVTFVDETRQWFKAVRGLNIRETGRDVAFCDHTIRQGSVMVVPDALQDVRFQANPLVTTTPQIRFYAGAPLVTSDGVTLGTVSVIDTVPHPDIAPEDKEFLHHLADMVVEELELRIAAGDVKAEIEARTRLEADLRRTSERFRLALTHSPVVLFTQDQDLRYTWIVNAPAPPETFIGHTDDEVWPPDVARAVTAVKREVLITGTGRRVEMAVGQGVQRRYYDTTLEPLFDDGTVVGLSGAAMDITDRRAARDASAAALVQAEAANRAKSQFLAAASHDLRQPMQSLLLMLGVLRERLHGSRHARVADQAAAAADALRGLLDDMLDISRIEAGLVRGRPSSFHIGELLTRLAAEYQPRAKQKGLQLRVHSCRTAVFTDVSLLERILRNLIENALRYTSEGGILLGCRRRGGQLRVEVVDTGIGLAEQHREAIFEEFVQLANPERDRTKGLGLGLAIVKRLADVLGHEVGVLSREDHGSIFFVDVPLASAAPVTEEDLKPPTEPQTPRGRVLVIDDERMVLEALALTLDNWGIDVTAAESVDDAVAALAGQSPPDAILADYRLRGDTTGVEAIQAVRAHCGTYIPSVLITGDTSPRRLAEAKASGHLLLHKPVSPHELRRVLTGLLTIQ